MENKCSVCHGDLKIYYKNFKVIIYYCYDCCHFTGSIFENEHDTLIFKDINKYKCTITSDEFYKTYYNIYSYFILSIKDFEKMQLQNNNPIIYFICESFSNIQHAKKGEYEFYSTNSMKYIASLHGLELVNIFVLTDSNKTIYEFVPMKFSMHYNLSKNIYESLYNEIVNDVYKTIY